MDAGQWLPAAQLRDAGFSRFPYSYVFTFFVDYFTFLILFVP